MRHKYRDSLSLSERERRATTRRARANNDDDEAIQIQIGQGRTTTTRASTDQIQIRTVATMANDDEGDEKAEHLDFGYVFPTFKDDEKGISVNRL